MASSQGAGNALSMAAYVLAGLVLCGNCAASDWTPTDEAVRDMMQGRCEAGVESANRGLKDGDSKAYFLVGFMRLKGLCVTASPDRAASYLELAAKAGQRDAARLLVMMHGFGIGVPQSYAQAGRWMVAFMDIAALSKGEAPSYVDHGASAPGQISLPTAERLGVIGSVASAVQDRLQYPGRGATLSARTVDLVLSLRLGPDGLRYSLSRIRSEIEQDLNSAIARRSAQPHIQQIQDVVEAVIEELPPYDLPASVTLIRIPYRFLLR
jgi:hypothetical protein